MSVYDPAGISDSIEASMGSGVYEPSWNFVPWLAFSSGYSVAGNPLYSATDFFQQYPNFGGTPVTLTGTLDGTTGVITGVSSIAGLAVGQYIAGIGIPSGATITNATGTTVTISKNTTVAGTPVVLTVYAAPVIPTAVLNAYIALAAGSLSSQAYGQTWFVAMGLFICHYLTLWAQGQGNPATSAAQIAANGLAIGIRTSKSVGDVSVGSTVLDFTGWGSFGLTLAGQQFATLAAAIGSASMLLY
jgi:hypothetical protein